MKRVILFRTLCFLSCCSFAGAEATSHVFEKNAFAIEIAKMRKCGLHEAADEIVQRKKLDMQVIQDAIEEEPKKDGFILENIYRSVSLQKETVKEFVDNYDAAHLLDYILCESVDKGKASRTYENFECILYYISRPLDCQVFYKYFVTSLKEKEIYSQEHLKHRQFQRSFAKGFVQNYDAAKVFVDCLQTTYGGCTDMFVNNAADIFSRAIVSGMYRWLAYSVSSMSDSKDPSFTALKTFCGDLQGTYMHDLIMSSTYVTADKMMDKDPHALVSKIAEEDYIKDSAFEIYSNDALLSSLVKKFDNISAENLCREKKDLWAALNPPQIVFEMVLRPRCFVSVPGSTVYCDFVNAMDNLYMRILQTTFAEGFLESYIDKWTKMSEAKIVLTYDRDNTGPGGAIAAKMLVSEILGERTITATGFKKGQMLRVDKSGMRSISCCGPFSFINIMDAFNEMVKKVLTIKSDDGRNFDTIAEFIDHAGESQKEDALEEACSCYEKMIFGNVEQVYMIKDSDGVAWLTQALYLANKASKQDLKKALVDAGQVLTIDGLSAAARGGEQRNLNAHYVNLSVMLLVDLVELNFLNFIYAIGSNNVKSNPEFGDLRHLDRLKIGANRDNLIECFQRYLSRFFSARDFLHQQAQIVCFSTPATEPPAAESPAAEQ